jgi:polyisoprenoid-binding protein YceI
MTAAELRTLLDSAEPPSLLHVLPEEVFAARRIPGSRNACVYEMAFAANATGQLPDRSAPVVVYGAGGGSQDCEVAAAQLLAAGYTSVSKFPGGLDEWTACGFPVEGHGRLPGEAPPADGDYVIDRQKSVIRWTGRNLFNHHSGTVGLAGGRLTLAGGRLVGAELRIDMRSIACEDLTDRNLNALLLKHLAHSDFFDTANHPEATFSLQACEPIDGAAPGTPNFILAGTFTLRGVSRPLSFPMVAADAGDGTLTGQALIELDRTEFGSIYGSGRFFRFLGQHVVNDIVHLHAKIHAAKA